MIKSFKFIVLIVLILQAATLAHAESESYVAFQTIQKEIATLAHENQLLKKQYEILNKEREQLLAEHKMESQEAERINALTQRRVEGQMQGQSSVGALEREVERIRGDMMLKETRLSYLSGEMLGMEERQKLWKLKIADLQYEKEQLEMELKRKELLTSEKKHKQEIALLDLKQTLMGKIQEEEAIRAQMKILHEHGGDPMGYVRQLRKKNESLRRELEQRRKDRAKRGQGLSQLDEETPLLQSVATDNRVLTPEDLARLEIEVAALEKEYTTLSEGIEASLSEQAQRKKMLVQVIAIDKQNQDLRQKITQLTEQVNILGR
jgi:hypothetical protein